MKHSTFSFLSSACCRVGSKSSQVFNAVILSFLFVFASGFNAANAQGNGGSSSYNDECSDAIQISIGQNHNGSTNTATTDNISSWDNDGTESSVWYYFIGSGSNVTLKLDAIKTHSCGNGNSTHHAGSSNNDDDGDDDGDGKDTNALGKGAQKEKAAGGEFSNVGAEAALH